jgi:solute carrier family 35 (UDP-galactose transporter), member B1
MFTSNYALNFVNYPMQALVKSSKIIPVMIIGIFRGTYSYPLVKYICAILITIGLIVFNLGGKKDDFNVSGIGAVLLVISLLFDGLLNTQSDLEKGKGNKTHAFHLMVSNNLVGAFFCGVLMLFNLEKIKSQLVLSNVFELVVIALAGTMGQLFIYLTMSKFDCFILTTVTTT